jgi:hypothetical protein
VRAALDRYSDRLDEALLSNCFAWMKKCQDDRMDTMVALLQKVLQLYAAKALKGQEAEVRCGDACCNQSAESTPVLDITMESEASMQAPVKSSVSAPQQEFCRP